MAESSFLRAYFRLGRTACRLAGRARHRRPGASGAAARQLEIERQRLARELHTGVGQALAAIRLQLDVLRTQIDHPTPAAVLALDRISALAAEALSEVRSVSSRLHPPDWQRLTLEDALRHLWNAAGIAQSFSGELRIESLAVEPGLDVKVLMYRSMQEALSNLVRHSRATRVDIALTSRGSSLVLSIRDNGIGFDPARANRGTRSGIGLQAIRDHAAAIGGCLIVESGAAGTTLEIAAPFESWPGFVTAS